MILLLRGSILLRVHYVMLLRVWVIITII